ncbi:hypothetical protein BDZ89DRAFT_1070727 [Hymenopellis radicata]|nr:hypothetical protein BDZ89DRAFT_1070727 [Hymenopellis radicata]
MNAPNVPAAIGMDALNVHAAIAPLPPNNNIRVRDIVRLIDRFVLWNMKATCMRNIHYEHDSYGAINDYLHSIFPPSRRFSIAPQGLLRMAVPGPDLSDTHTSQATDSSDDGNQVADTSLGSFGAFHASRNRNGPEKGKKYIDFTVSKVSPTSITVPEQELLTFVEVKRELLSNWANEKQMRAYMLLVASQPRRAPNFRAFMVSVRSHEIVEYYFTPNGAVSWTGATDFFLPGTQREHGDILTEKLANIASRFWN